MSRSLLLKLGIPFGLYYVYNRWLEATPQPGKCNAASALGHTLFFLARRLCHIVLCRLVHHVTSLKLDQGGFLYKRVGNQLVVEVIRFVFKIASVSALRSLYRISNNFENSQAKADYKREGMFMETVTLDGSIEATWYSVNCSFSELNDQALVVMYIHGGGYVYGSHETYAGALGSWAKRIGSKGQKQCGIVSIEYPLLPENQPPAALETCCRALAYLMSTFKHIGARVVVAGDSAGGCLALSTCMSKYFEHQSGERGGFGGREARDLPDGLLLISPWVNHEISAKSYVSNAASDYLDPLAICETSQMHKEPCVSNPFISPVTEGSIQDQFWSHFGSAQEQRHLAQRRGAFPRTMIIAGAREVFYDDCLLLAKKLKECDVQVELLAKHKLMHVYPMLYPSVCGESVEEALNMMSDFVCSV